MAADNDAIAEAAAFNDAFAAPEPGPAPTPDAGGADDGGQARDERGRFAGNRENRAEDQPQPQERAQPDAERHHIPLAEHLSEREKRQAAERRAEEYERKLAALERAQAEAAAPKRERPDLYADPDGYAAFMDAEREDAITRIERKMQARFLDASFEDAKEQHGERFTQAYEAVMAEKARGNRTLVDRIINAANPGRLLMKWYGEQEAIREIGGDIGAYRKRVLDEARKDPEYRKQVLADMEAEARGGNTIVDRSNITDLPSLTRAAGGGSRGSPMGDSDGELFASAFGRQRR